MAKSDNTIVAAAFEEAVINKDLNFDGVKEVLEIINSLFPEIISEENIGRKYKTANGDLIINDKTIELKHITTDGLGTHLNTSMYNLTKYGCLPFKPFQEKHGVFNLLETKFGPSVRNRLSPVEVSKASEFYKNNKEFCDEVAELDKLARKDYVLYLYEYFKQNKEKCLEFLKDCLTKNISEKQPADITIVYNSKFKKAFYLTKEQVLNRNLEGLKISSQGLGLVFNSLRINIGWQNHNGISNPTLRVFLK